MLKRHIKWFITRIHRDRLDSTAAHGAYFIIISFLPFCVFTLTILQQIELESGPLITELMTVFPDPVADYMEGLIAQTLPTSSVLSVSILTFLWSASSGMVAVMKGIETVYESRVNRNYFVQRLVAMGYLLVFSIALILTAVTLVFGQTIYNKLLNHSPSVLLTLLLNLKSLLGFFLLVIFFCLIFNGIPRKRVKFINNLFGATFSAAGWVLFSYVFSIFVENFSNYSVVYGSLATLIVIMLWLFFCMYIIFLGGEVAMWLEHSGIQADLRNYFSVNNK